MLIMGGKVSCLIMKLHKASNLLFQDARGKQMRDKHKILYRYGRYWVGKISRVDGNSSITVG